MAVIEGWFPTPVYSEDIGTDDIKAEIDAYLADNPLGNAFSFWNDDVDTTFTKKEPNNILMETCPTFKAEVERCILEFLDALDYSGVTLKFVESWANQTSKGQFQNHHEHGASDISGAYYHESLGVPEQGELIFKTPVLASVVSRPMLRQHSTIHYTSIPGRLVLFPSYLTHGVTVNQTDVPRISCSFNARMSLPDD